MKKCNCCGIIKHESEFQKNGWDRKGIQMYANRCRPCLSKIRSEQKRFKQTVHLPPKPKNLPPQTYKVCRDCGNEILLTSFPTDNIKVDGHSSYCKPCDYIRRKQNKLDNPERTARTLKNWKELNPLWIKRWYANNVGKVRAYSSKRRARKLRATPLWVETDDIEKLYDLAVLYGEISGVKRHVDHIVPLKHDLVCGLHCLDNLQILTESENCKKSNKFLVD